MAISYVGGATAVSTGNTDVSVSLTALTGGSDSAPSNGDLIIFAYNIADADNVDLNLACNTAGFTEIADLFGNGAEDANLGVYWKIHNGDTAVVGEGSLGGTDTAIQGVVMVFRGVDQASPFDATIQTNTGTTGGNPDPPQIDWSTAGTWTVIVGSNAHTANTNGTFTAPTNYTTDFLTVGNQDTADGIIGMGYRTNPADPENPGSMTSSATASGWCAATLAIKVGATSVAVGQVTETDLSQSIAKIKQRAVGQSLETDVAQSLGKIKVAALGHPTETDLANVITTAKRYPLGLAEETDLAQEIVLAGPIIIPVAQVIETDLAQVLGKQKVKALDQALETDLAQPIGKQKLIGVGQSIETDLAQPIIEAISQIIPVGQVVETDLAQSISVVIVPSSSDPGWLGGGPIVRKRKAWPLPPPAFPIIEDAPEVLTLGKAEPIPKWVKVVESKLSIKPGGLEHIPPKPEPVEDRPKRIPRRIKAKIVEYQAQGPTVDDIIREWKRREEEEIVMSLVMHGQL